MRVYFMRMQYYMYREHPPYVFNTSVYDSKDSLLWFWSCIHHFPFFELNQKHDPIIHSLDYLSLANDPISTHDINRENSTQYNIHYTHTKWVLYI
jgi:hypothetical protein